MCELDDAYEHAPVHSLEHGFSKKVENHATLHFVHYCFRCAHPTLRAPPAMAAGVTDHLRGAEAIAGLLG